MLRSVAVSYHVQLLRQRVAVILHNHHLLLRACCLYCLLPFYQSILSSQRRSVTSTSSGAESSVKAFFLSFCKDNRFFWESILFLLFFSLFSLPWLLHSLPWLLLSLPWLSHSLPWFCCHIPLSNVCPTHPTCRGRSFKKLPGVLKLLPLQGALLIALYPGCCPGLWASALSGALLASFVLLIALYPGRCPGLRASAPFRACCLRLLQEKAFTFWAFLSQRVHRFTPFVTFSWIPVKGGFTPWIPSVYRASGADVKGEPSFLALYAYAKENK